jgi:hypothetical protein
MILAATYERSSELVVQRLFPLGESGGDKTNPQG